MNKKQWDKLPIGTVLTFYDKGLWYCIEIKSSKNCTMVLWDVEGDYYWGQLELSNYGRDEDMLEYLEIAPKWIQDCFKIE